MQFAEVFGNSSLDPMPKGILVGDLAIALRIDGTDPVTGALGRDLDEQIVNAYASLRAFVDASDATLENVAQVSFYFHGTPQPGLINDRWVELFPEPSDRATYKFMSANLPAGELIRLEAFVVPGARRRVIPVDGVAHTNPIPMAVRIGRYLFTSRMLPYDPATEGPAESLEAQADFIFQHAKTVLDRAEMDWSNVTQGRAFFADDAGHAMIVERWRQHVAGNGPAPPLHPIRYQAGNLLTMLEFMAVSHDASTAT